jgi:hypothetical protein
MLQVGRRAIWHVAQLILAQVLSGDIPLPHDQERRSSFVRNCQGNETSSARDFQCD